MTNSVYTLPCSFTLTVTPALLEITDRVRDTEAKCRKRFGQREENGLIRTLIAGKVTKASLLAADLSLSDEDFLSSCFSMKGKPWEEARMRRDMRERIRLYRRLSEGTASVPGTPEELIGLWKIATEGEVPLYREAGIPQFRVKGIPFAHTAFPFETAPVPGPGFITADPEDIPREVEALLGFIHEKTIPLEIRAAAAHFIHGHIHPFRDGNGHTARTLTCSMLSEHYSRATLLSFLSHLQSERKRMGEAICDTVAAHSDAENVTRLCLELLLESISAAASFNERLISAS